MKIPTENQLLQETKKIKDEMQKIKDSNDGGASDRYNELTRQLTIKRHELKLIKTVVGGSDEIPPIVKSYFMSKEERIKEKKKQEKAQEQRELYQAAVKVRKDKNTVKELAKGLSKKELQSLLKEKSK